MASELAINIALGASQTGLSLEAVVRDTAGTPVGSPIATGFFEVGGGDYLWDYALFPDSFRGGVQFRVAGGGAHKAFVAINPDESLDEINDATHGLAAIRARGDAAWITATGFPLATDYTAPRAAKLDNLDVAVSSRLATAGYTVPPTTAAIVSAIDASSADLDLILAGVASVFARTDVATSTRLAAADYTDAPAADDIAAAVLRRDVSLDENDAGEYSLTTLQLMAFNSGPIVAGALPIRKTTGAAYGSVTIASAAEASPIISTGGVT